MNSICFVLDKLIHNKDKHGKTLCLWRKNVSTLTCFGMRAYVFYISSFFSTASILGCSPCSIHRYCCVWMDNRISHMLPRTVYCSNVWCHSRISSIFLTQKFQNQSEYLPFFFALLAQSSGQRGVIWWARNHRHHHRYSDKPQDLHSPAAKRFLACSHWLDFS